VEEFRRSVDEMLEYLRSKIGYPLGSGSAALKPPIESFMEEGRLTVRVELPGIDPKDSAVNVAGDMLTIRASRQEEHETKKRDFLHREFRYGAIERLMSLPQGVKAENVKASFSNGLLQLTISIPEETTPKEVKVHVEHAESKPADRKTAEFAIFGRRRSGLTSEVVLNPSGNVRTNAYGFSLNEKRIGAYVDAELHYTEGRATLATR